MSGLRHEEWLHLAKKCAVGSRARHKHGNERRHNLIVANEVDKYWAYCQACKTGGVHMKEHVTHVQVAPAVRDSLTLPDDLLPVHRLSPFIVNDLIKFLHGKNMSLQYIDDLLYSQSRARLVVRQGDLCLGRDVTDKSMQKWLQYTPGVLWHRGKNTLEELDCAVLVEDPFSYCKLVWAAREHNINASVFCVQGTSMSSAIMARVVGEGARVLVWYDGDAAGVKGARQDAARLNAVGVQARALNIAGKDPKDLQVAEIAAVLLGA